MGAQLMGQASHRALRKLVEAALPLTRMTRPMRRACVLVLVEGKSMSEAARLVGRERQNVYRALKRVRQVAGSL